jgi:hypothetical protein
VYSRLDSIGIAGFSHDFRTLDGEYSSVAAAFESLSFEGQSLLSILLFMLGTRIPLLVHLPVERNRIIAKLRREMGVIATSLLEKTRREKKKEVPDETADKSVIGLLRNHSCARTLATTDVSSVKAEEENAELYMDETEVMAQVGCFASSRSEPTNLLLTSTDGTVHLSLQLPLILTRTTIRTPCLSLVGLSFFFGSEHR